MDDIHRSQGTSNIDHSSRLKLIAKKKFTSFHLLMLFFIVVMLFGAMMKYLTR